MLLSISDFGTLPLQVSVSDGGLLQIDSITVSSVVKDPTGLTSPLMNVEISSYEVSFTRADRGTRVPRPFVEHIFGVITPGVLVVADVSGADLLDRRTMQLIGRALALRGEALFLIRDDALVPASMS